MNEAYVSDEDDALRCANMFLHLTECYGGRMVVSGYVCPHCESTNPSTECGAPVIESIKEKGDE